jgi:tryptophan-rich sensory protein
MLALKDAQPMTWMEWYDSLAKLSWTPAPATISLVWMILYPVILISFGFVFVRAFQGKVSRLVAIPFAINLVANLLFHADLFGATQRATSDGGHRYRVGHDHLVHGRYLAGL